MRVENLEHLLNEEATDINEMLKVTVAIILSPSYLDHHHHCHHHCIITIIFIIIKRISQVISNIQTGKEGIDIKSMKKRYM